MATLLAAGQYGSTQAAADDNDPLNPDEFVVPQQPVRPTFEVDPFWPQPIPEWRIGQVAGLDVDQHDQIWFVQRPGSLDANEIRGEHIGPAPPVMAFDPDGNLITAWGPEAGPPGEPREWDGCEWPVNEHGLWVDGDDNVWIGGNGPEDHVVLKLSSDGDCLMQIGEWGETGGSNDPELLGQPADGDTDDAEREVYIADGYENRRVIVFDMDTGEYQRHWGAYGTVPVDDDPPPGLGFGNPTHCSVLSNDDLVYVCDRPNNRIQVFEKDGTFVSEFFIRQPAGFLGSTWDWDFSPDPPKTFGFNADGTHEWVDIFDRRAEERIGGFGRPGRWAGEFHWLHNLSTDSRGNIYTAEVDTGKRAQKFNWTGFEPRVDDPDQPPPALPETDVVVPGGVNPQSLDIGD